MLSTVLGLPYFAWSSRFLQPERSFFSYLVIVLWSTELSPLAQLIFWGFCLYIVTQFELVKLKFLIRLHWVFFWVTFVIFWPSTRPKNAIPRWCTGRKWHIPMVSNRKRSHGRIKAYNMGQGEGPTVPLQWCTGREWPMYCMTVISAWWRLNIRFQRSSGRSCGRWIII